MGFLRALIRPLKSRKVRTGLATVAAAYLAQWGLDVGTEIIMTILGVGISIILGVAVEDAGAKSRSQVNVSSDRTGRKK